MIKPLLRLLFLLLLLSPLTGYCQLPYPKWVNDMGGAGDSKPTGMVADGQNNIYVAGYFSGTVDFDPSAGQKNLTSAGGYDIYVAKYKADGTLVWAISMGGNDLDQVNAMGIDANGNPTIIGQFRSLSLNAGGFFLTSTGDEDIFVIHMDTNGNVLWANTHGAFGTDRGEQVTADAQGNVIATAIFQQTISVGSHTETAPGGFGALVIKYSSAGAVQWDINLSSNGGDTQVFGNGIDSQGNVVVSGSYSGTVDFDPLGTHQNSPTFGSNTPFLAKYTPAGKLIWVKYVGGSFVNNGSALSIDANDDIYFTGSFATPLTFNGSTILNLSGYQDTFVAKYSSNGTFAFAKDIGGFNAGSFNYMIRNDKAKNVYITGYFTGTIDFNPTAAVANVADHGQRDFYLAKYDLNGNYQWAFSAGSPNCNLTLGIEIAVINVDDVVLGGSFCSTVNFDPSACTVTNRTAQNFTSDSFVARYVQGASAITQITGFTVPLQIAPAVIDQANLTVTVAVPHNTNVTALAPTIVVSNGGTLSPASGVAQNFTNPVNYTASGGCAPVVYKVTMLIARAITTCSGTANTIAGDTPTPAGTIAWQVLQNGSWVNAPGTINAANYQTSALVNNAAADITFNLRRQITAAGGSIAYDSYYEVTVQSSTPITGNTATAPAVSGFCATGDPASITGSTPAGGNGVYVYQWQRSADNVTFTDIAGATTKDYDPAAISVTTYYQRIVSSGTCAAPAKSNLITISVTPAISNNTITAPAVTSFCATGDAAVITGSTPTGGTGNYAYQWQRSADNVTFTDIAATTTKDYNPPAGNSTVYYRRAVTSGTCNVLSNVVTVNVLPQPANVVLTPIAPICAGSGASLSVSAPDASLTYIWYDSPAKVNTLFTGATFSTNPLNGNQTYYVEASNGTCTSPALTGVTVTVVQMPANPAVVTNPVSVCNGTSATLAIASPQAGLTYKWYSTAAGTTPAFTGQQFVTGPLTTNTAYYVDATNATGCVSPRIPVNLNMLAVPSIAAQGATICAGSGATLTASSTDNNVTIKWYADATGGNSVFTGASFTTQPVNVATTYYAEATNNATGCISVARAPATIQLAQPLPAPVATPGDVTATSVSFKWDAVPNATGYLQSLDNGQTFVATGTANAGITISVQRLTPGQTVNVIIKATGALPCQLSSNSNLVTLTAIDPLADQPYVANAFTPNGDGKNDVVYVHSENINTLKFSVYNQWGELLFSSVSVQYGWDGTFKGKAEPAGVYVYYVQATMKTGKQITKKGTITLIR